MASSATYRAQLNHLRQGYLSRNDVHSKGVVAPPAITADNLIDLTSYEEEYDYLVARRRAVSSTSKKLDDAVTRIRDESKAKRRKDAGQSRDDDDYEQIARMLSLNQSESNPRPTNLNLDQDILSPAVDTVEPRRTTPRSLASPSSQPRTFPSTLSLQIREELEEIKKVTSSSIVDDGNGDKRSIIRLEDILGVTKAKSNRTAHEIRGPRVYSPDPIPTTPSLEADYYASDKPRRTKHGRNDPDKLRVLTPEPIPTSPSLETELTLRSRRSSGNRDIQVRQAPVEPIPETVNIEDTGTETDQRSSPPPSSLKKSSYRMPADDLNRTIIASDRKQSDVIKQAVSKSVSFHGEIKPIISVVDTDDKDEYGEIEIPGDSGTDGGAGSGSLWSPSYESDPMLGSKSMYRRAIMARRKKSAARTGADGSCGVGFSGAASTTLSSRAGGAFKPIVRDYEELEEIELTSPTVHGNQIADKYRSLAISPVKSSMDQDDSFWILSPSPRRSPQDTGNDDEDTREEEDGERSSLEGDKRENDEISRFLDGKSALPPSKSLSPTAMRSIKGEFDYDDVRAAKSLSFRQKDGNASRPSEINPTRHPSVTDVESKVSEAEFEVSYVTSNGASGSSPRNASPWNLSPRNASPRRHLSSPKTSDMSSTPLRRHIRPSSDQRISKSRNESKDGILDLVSDIPGIPAAKSEPGGWRANGKGIISVDELEVPQAMTEPKKNSAPRVIDVSSLSFRSQEGLRSKDTTHSVPSKFVREFLDEPIIAPDLPTLDVESSDVVSVRSRSPQRARVTPESPSRSGRSLVQQRLSAEIRKAEEITGSKPRLQGRDSPYKPTPPVIDAEDFTNVVNGGGEEIKAIDSVIKLVNTFDDDDGGTDVAFEAPIPKPYSRDLAISESESSTSQLDSDQISESAGALEEASKRKQVVFGATATPKDPKGATPGHESECENTSCDDSYAVGKRRYTKYSSDENCGQTSGNETDSKLSIINSESSESELGVDPDLDPHVLYDSEAMRFVVQILDRSCAWLEDDGCACNFQGQPSSLLREIKRKSRAGPIPSSGFEKSQAPTPRVSNSKKSRVSGKASSLVRMVAKQNPGGPLVQKLHIDKERRSQRSAQQQPSESDDCDKSSQNKVSVFARPRRRQTSPRRMVLPDSDTGSSDDPETVQRSPPRRRRSQSPRKRSTGAAKEDVRISSPLRSSSPIRSASPNRAAPKSMAEDPGSLQDETVEETQPTDCDSAVSPFQKKLQERLASVRGQSQSDSSVGPDLPDSSLPVEQSHARSEAQIENGQVPERIQRSPSPASSPTSQPQNQAPIGAVNTRSLSPAGETRPLAVSNLRSIAAESSATRRNGLRSASPGSVSGLEKMRSSHQSKSDIPGSPRRAESRSSHQVNGSRQTSRDTKESRDQRPQSRKTNHGETRSRTPSRTPKSPRSAAPDSPAAAVPSSSHRRPTTTPTTTSSASSVNSGSGGPEHPSQRRRGDHVTSSLSFASTSQLSSASFVSRGGLETIPEQLTPLSSTPSSPSSASVLGRTSSNSPFHGLTEAERLAALELAEKLRRRASNLKRRRRARERRMSQFLTDEEDEEDPALN